MTNEKITYILCKQLILCLFTNPLLSFLISSDPFFDEMLLVPFSHVPMDDVMGSTGTTTGATK